MYIYTDDWIDCVNWCFLPCAVHWVVQLVVNVKLQFCNFEALAISYSEV